IITRPARTCQSLYHDKVKIAAGAKFAPAARDLSFAIPEKFPALQGRNFREHAQFSTTFSKLLYFSSAARRRAEISKLPEKASSDIAFAVNITLAGNFKFFISESTRPLWRVPIKSPPPLSSRSASAILKPSELFFI